MVKVTCQVESCDNPVQSSIYISSHWRSKRLVTILIGNETREVDADEMLKSINHCSEPVADQLPPASV